VAGTAGMSLATVIRLEFAYPGVGVLAGDSLQYLSTATAHGVIMVFYMIMPAIFGAFGNFLLPTQLGVHDVAFPRLNSAAFWFLPGGLIMLCHLVCTDRRYARMNCFNIRELQSILKRKFFTDLVNTHDHRDLLEQSMIGLRYKNNNTIQLNSDVLSFYNFGISNLNLNTLHLFFTSPNKTLVLGNYNAYFLTLFNFDNSSIRFMNFYFNVVIYYFQFIFINYMLYYPFFSLSIFIKTFLLNLGGFSLTNLNFLSISNISQVLNSKNNYFIVQDNNKSTTFIKDTFLESNLFSRFNRFSNALINYDYKTGHYVGN
jgi:hypothetical protein